MQWRIETHRNISWTDLEKRQDELVKNLPPSEGVLLFSEPQPTFTCGRSGTPADLLWSSEELAKKGIATASVSRGGKWTFHGPGQLVLYPIVRLQDLSLPSKGSRLFVDTFRDTLLDFLKALRVPALKKEAPYGLYVGESKIASFGLHFREGISCHGAAVYLKNQSPFFAGIHPCGAPDVAISSLEDLGYHFSWEDSVSQTSEHVKRGFNLIGKPLL